MDKRLVVLCFLAGVAMMVLAFPEGFVATLLVLVCSAAVIFIIKFFAKEDTDFLVQIFLIALLARLSLGLFIHVYDLRVFFGGDANTYDALGYKLIEIWFYNAQIQDFWSQRALSTSGSGWGMYYLVGIIYSITGRNILAAQAFCGVIGAATVPLVYNCAYKIFNNRRVGKISAVLVALYPAFIIWTGQLLKDGLVIFLLVLAMLMVLRLQKRFNNFDIIMLGFSLFGIMALRFYIFYMATVAIVGAFVIGTSNSPQAIARRIVVMMIIGIGLTYIGMTRNIGTEIDEYADLQRIERSRKDLAESAESGYGEDLDVSTTEGAIVALPVGLIYLMLAPFPWQISNFRQLITLPEVLLWWASIPFLLSGLWYTIRNRLRDSIPILVFSLMLALAYSIFLGNVGTAYRQRTQIQVFLFMFIAVGFTLFKERRENKKLIRQARNRETENSLRQIKAD